MELLSRRGFVGGLIAFVAAAPAVIRSGVLMPVKNIILPPSITERLTRAHENGYQPLISGTYGFDENGYAFGEELEWPKGFNPRVTLKPGEMIINPPMVRTFYKNAKTVDEMNARFQAERASMWAKIEAEFGEL